MVKTCFTYDHDWQTCPVSIIPVSRRGPDRGFFTKQASFLDSTRALLKPRKGYTPLFVYAMGAGEHFGANRNADYWPQSQTKVSIYRPKDEHHKTAEISAGLKERAGTFVTHAKVYKDHKNHDPALASGDIAASSYNEKMGRVETISYVENDKWASELALIEKGEHIPFSMSARVPWDQCSFCGNKAKSRAQYCEHLRKHANMISDDGHQIVAINERPTFIDLSGVKRNADRIGYGLAKVASEGPVKTGAELAEDLGIHCPEEALLSISDPKIKRRLEILQKLSAMEKEIEAAAAGLEQKNVTRSTDPRDQRSLPAGVSSIIQSSDPSKAFRALSQEDIVLPLRSFLSLFLPEAEAKHASLIKEAQRALRGCYDRIRREEDLESFLAGQLYQSDNTTTDELRKAAGLLRRDYSLHADAVSQRIARSIVDHKDAPRIQRIHVPCSKRADLLAREYVKYQITALENASPNQLKTRIHLTMLSNMV